MARAIPMQEGCGAVLLGAVLAAAVAVPVRAIELRGGVRGETAYNSNVLATEDDEEDDVSFRATPWFRVEDDRGDLTWAFGYRAGYEAYVDQNDLNGWDHDVKGELSWRLRPDTTISIEDRFVRFESVTRFNETITDDAGQAITEARGRINRFRRNEAEIEIEHMLSPVDVLTATGRHALFEFSDEQRTDRWNAAVIGSYRRILSETDTVGAFLSWRRQGFDDPGLSDDRETDFYNVSGSWTHRFDPTFEFTVAGGPTLVDPRTSQAEGDIQVQSLRFPGRVLPGLQTPGAATRLSLLDPTSCPRLDDGTPFLDASCDLVSPTLLLIAPFQVEDLRFDDTQDADSRVTFFADVSVRKSWENWLLTLSYRRQEDAAGGVAFSAIADIVTGSIVWTPSPRWRFAFTTSWVRQEQSTDGIQPEIALRSANVNGFRVASLGGIPVLVPGTGSAAEAFALRGREVSDEFEQKQLTAVFNATYRLTRRISLFGSLLYVDVERDGGFGAGNDFDRVRGALGFTFEFDPIRL